MHQMGPPWPAAGEGTCAARQQLLQGGFVSWLHLVIIKATNR